VVADSDEESRVGSDEGAEEDDDETIARKLQLKLQKEEKEAQSKRALQTASDAKLAQAISLLSDEDDSSDEADKNKRNNRYESSMKGVSISQRSSSSCATTLQKAN
jgi:hypothetical protein